MVMTFLDVKRADRNYEYFFGDLYGLMLNAGKAVADTVSEEFGDGNRITIICGPGNNGGDGLVAAELLREKNTVEVHVARGPDNMKTSESRRAAKKYGGKLISREELDESIAGADILVDAIFGSGITGNPRGPIRGIIESMNNSGKHVVSIDVPSGIGTDMPVVPDLTITFTDIKEGMDEQNSGRIVVKEIGIPEKAFTHNGPGDFAYYRLPGPDSHKGMNGVVSMIAGWTFHGSAVIAARGAIKAGADLVRVYSTQANIQAISSYSPDIIVRNIDSGDLSEELRSAGAILFGPGLGKGQKTSGIIKTITGYSGRIILDAEGLQELSSIRAACPQAELILTPHRQEFRRISGEEAELESVVRFARKNSCTVVLKGHRDIITDGKAVRYTEGGNARMTMGGTGDLLAGLIAAISERVDTGFQAACIASFVNKAAGEMAFRQKAFWYDLADMIEKVPEAMKLSMGVAST